MSLKNLTKNAKMRKEESKPLTGNDLKEYQRHKKEVEKKWSHIEQYKIAMSHLNFEMDFVICGPQGSGKSQFIKDIASVANTEPKYVRICPKKILGNSHAGSTREGHSLAPYTLDKLSGAKHEHKNHPQTLRAAEQDLFEQPHDTDPGQNDKSYQRQSKRASSDPTIDKCEILLRAG